MDTEELRLIVAALVMIVLYGALVIYDARAKRTK
jgi:hypothetical protein